MWSGDRIVYARLRRNDPRFRSDVRAVDAASGSDRALYSAAGTINLLALAPDGRRLAIVTGRHGGPGVTALDLSSRDHEVLVARCCASGLSWAPDGQQMAISGIDGPLLSIADAKAKRLRLTSAALPCLAPGLVPRRQLGDLPPALRRGRQAGQRVRSRARRPGDRQARAGHRTGPPRPPSGGRSVAAPDPAARRHAIPRQPGAGTNKPSRSTNDSETKPTSPRPSASSGSSARRAAMPPARSGCTGALAIRAGLGVPEIAIDVHCLGEHRAALGEEPFRQALTAGIGAEGAAEMIAALDDLARREAKGDDPGAGDAG